MERKYIELDQSLIEKLLKFPEAGMGYQLADVLLNDGRTLRKRIVLNSSALVLNEGENLQSEEILDVSNFLSDSKKKEIVSDIIKELDILHYEVDVIIRGFYGEELDDIMLYHIGILEKYQTCIESTRVLLEVYPNSRYVEETIGLSLRSSILTYLIGEYLGTFLFEKEFQFVSDFEPFLYEMHKIQSDHIYHSIEYLFWQYSNSLIDEKKYKSSIKYFYNKYSDLFKEPVDPKFPKKSLKHKPVSIAQMIKRIAQSGTIEDSNLIHSAIDIYNVYSKYDHYGVLTYGLQRRPESEELISILDSFIIIRKGIFRATLYFSLAKHWDKTHFVNQLNSFQSAIMKLRNELE